MRNSPDTLDGYSNAMYINEKIFSPHDKNMIIQGARGRFDMILDKSRKSEGERIYNWYQSKLAGVYKIMDPKARSILSTDLAKIRSGFKGLDSADIFNKMIEFAFEDLYGELFGAVGIKVIKTSEYDDTVAGIDFLFIGHNSLIGIDINFSTNTRIISEDKRKYSTPIEYNIYNGARFRSEVYHGGIRLEIHPADKIQIKRILLPIEPNLAQLYFKEYMDQIGKGSLGSAAIKNAWSKAISRYRLIGTSERGLYVGTTPSGHLEKIKLAQEDILNALLPSKGQIEMKQGGNHSGTQLLGHRH